MAVTQAQIEARVVRMAPRFCERAWEARLKTFAELSIERHMDSDDWSSDKVYTQAMACFVLHYLTLAEQEDSSPTMAAAAGPVGSIRTMDESVSFASPAAGSGGTQDAFMRGTTWGKQYLSLRDTRPDAHSFAI